MKELSKEEMLKRLQELEEENKKLKEEKRMAENLKGIITKDDIFSVFKRLISQSTQTFSLLWKEMNISDRTIRNFISWTAEDGSEKTYGAIGDYYTKHLKEAFLQLLKYKAYNSAPDDGQRTELYHKLALAYQNMMDNLERLIYKKIYTIEENNFKASWEFLTPGFLVYKWSELAYHVLEDTNIRILRGRKELYLDGVIEKNVGSHTVVFLKDYTFKSPTAAAEVICGRTVNGRIKWKSEGKTLDELERKNECIE